MLKYSFVAILLCLHVLSIGQQPKNQSKNRGSIAEHFKQTDSSVSYTFIGNGKWSDSNNWTNKTIPPDILDNGSKIVINPVSNGQCVADTLQFVTRNASIFVQPGKKLIIPSNRNIATGVKLFTGTITFPKGTAVEMNALTIRSFLHEAKPTASGSFKIMMSDKMTEDILTVTNKANELSMIKYINDTISEFDISPQSTAIALLILYPLLKPIDVEQKKVLIEKYKLQPEFSQLVSEIESLTKQEKNLFDSTNDKLINLINVLVSKEYNDTRYRLGNSTKTLSDPKPITIASQASDVILTNNAECSYTGQIFKANSNVALGEPFNVAGKYVKDNLLLKSVLLILNGLDGYQKERTVNLKQFGGVSGEYEIRLTSGDPAIGGTQLNKRAINQNLSELLAMILANTIPGVTEWIDNPCIKEVVNTSLNAVNTSAVIKAVEEDKVLNDYVKPLVFDIVKSLETTPADCIAVAKAKTVIEELIGYVSFIGKLAPEIKYVSSWAANPKTVVGCQYLDQNFNTSSCFEVIASPLPSEIRTCETVPLLASTVEKEKYYPYTTNPVANKDIVLQALDGKFTSSNFLGILNLKTDQFGDARTDWISPSAVKEAKVKAVAYADGVEISSDTFITNTRAIVPIAGKLGDAQTGEINKPLSKYIQFSVLDKGAGISPEAIPFDKYLVKYVITGGGSIKLKPDELNQGIYVINEWTLGNTVGEQSVTVAISTTSCDNSSSPPREILKFKFTATAYDPKKIYLTTSPPVTITSSSVSTGGNIVNDGGSTITARGVCWSTSHNPTIADNKTNDGTGNGTYVSNIAGLIANTTYYVRAYATNSAGTVYGNEVSFRINEIQTKLYKIISWSRNYHDSNGIKSDGTTNEGTVQLTLYPQNDSCSLYIPGPGSFYYVLNGKHSGNQITIENMINFDGHFHPLSSVVTFSLLDQKVACIFHISYSPNSEITYFEDDPLEMTKQ